MKLYKVALLIIGMNFLSGSNALAAAAGGEPESITVLVRCDNIEQSPEERFRLNLDMLKKQLTSAVVERSTNQYFSLCKTSHAQEEFKSKYPDKEIFIRIYEQKAVCEGLLRAKPVDGDKIITCLEYPVIASLEVMVKMHIPIEDEYGSIKGGSADVRCSLQWTAQELANWIAEGFSTLPTAVDFFKQLRGSHCLRLYNVPNGLETDLHGYPRFVSQPRVLLDFQTKLNSLKDLALIARFEKEDQTIG